MRLFLGDIDHVRAALMTNSRKPRRLLAALFIIQGPYRAARGLIAKTIQRHVDIFGYLNAFFELQCLLSAIGESKMASTAIVAAFRMRLDEVANERCALRRMLAVNHIWLVLRPLTAFQEGTRGLVGKSGLRGSYHGNERKQNCAPEKRPHRTPRLTASYRALTVSAILSAVP